MNKKKEIGKLIIIFVIYGIAFFNPIKAEASSENEEFKEMFGEDVKEEDIVKHGKYYFRYYRNNEDGNIVICVQMSVDKINFIDIPVTRGNVTNGKCSYYVSDSSLYKYSFSTRKNTKIKKLPKYKFAKNEDKNVVFNVEVIHGNNLYLTKHLYDHGFPRQNDTYVYNLKSKKLKCVQKFCRIIAYKNGYAVGKNMERTDVSPYPLTLYKFTKSGMKVVKKLTDEALNFQVIGSKIYYSEQTSKGLSLYKCDFNGKNKKKIKTFKNTAMMPLTKITKTYCIVWLSGKKEGLYIYKYKTKKFISIN